LAPGSGAVDIDRVAAARQPLPAHQPARLSKSLRQQYLDLPPVAEEAPQTPARERGPATELSWSVAARNSMLNLRDSLAERHAAAGLVHVLAVIALTAGALAPLAGLFAYAWR